jgi:hypothetical protein
MPQRKPLPKIATTLPPDAREALIAASKLRDPRERKAAVQAAIERAQRKYPYHFNTTQGATP